MNEKENARQSHDDATPVFGLPKAQLQPIVDSIAGEPVAAFEVGIEHELEGHYGYAGEKAIPTFTYATRPGRAGRETVFVKWLHEPDAREPVHYEWLVKHQAPIPRLYGVLKVESRGPMLFLEHLHEIINNEKFLEDEERFRQFLALAARFNAIAPSREYAALLPDHGLCRTLTSMVSVLEAIWELAGKGRLGNDLAAFCSGPDDKLSHLQELATRLIEPVSRMETGLCHTDLYPENTGRRPATGELLLLDLELVARAPRFFDAACWLGAPDDIRAWPLPREELAQHYLGEYARCGGCPAPLDEFLEETRTLWMAAEITMLGWKLGRALDGRVDGAKDPEEGRRIYCEDLYESLSGLLREAP